MSDNARVLQVKVLSTKIAELQQAGYSIVYTGDFNAQPSTEVYAEMVKTLTDAKAIAENADDGLTAHGYGKNEDYSAGTIDYVFVSDGTEVDTYKIIRNTVKDMYPSDHYPVVADVKF